MGTVYFAKWILLETDELLENGAIAVSDNIITSIGQRSKVRRNPGDRFVNLGDCLVLPGLINMHTHLEEGIVRGIQKDNEETFAAWSTKRHARVRQTPSEQVQLSIRLGIRELLAQGITTILDSSRLGLSGPVLSEESIRAFVIREYHTDDPAQEQHILRELTEIEPSVACSRSGSGPYSLYSLSPESQQILLNHTVEKKLLWSTHLAESAEELQAFSEHTGDLFFQITRKRPWPFGERSIGSMNYAMNANLLPEGAICYHCNYVNGYELDYLVKKNAAIVLCQKYTQEIGHKTFPLDAALNRKATICLGTEGITPPGFMSLFDELYSLKISYPHIPAIEMLKWVTKNPARALNMEDKLGSLSVGKLADIIAVRFAHDPGEVLLEELLIEEPEVMLVVVDGEEVIVNY